MFEWDVRTAVANRTTHGVAFEEAQTVFGDPDALDGPDLRHSERESRPLRLGRAAAGRVAMVAYTVRRREDPHHQSAVRAGRARQSGRRTRQGSGIDFSDILEASKTQLRSMRRVGRPPLGAEARRSIAIRVDPQVLGARRREAKQRGVGYQSLINIVLARHVRRARTA